MRGMNYLKAGLRIPTTSDRRACLDELRELLSARAHRRKVRLSRLAHCPLLRLELVLLTEKNLGVSLRSGYTASRAVRTARGLRRSLLAIAYPIAGWTSTKILAA